MSWEQLAPQTIQRLSNDLQISPQVAAGIVGQLGYESAGLQSINEYKPVVPGSRGGFGWAQWTGPRRRQFESWAKQNNMDVTDPEANYQFLVYELTQTPEKRVLDKIRGIEDPVEAGKVFTDTFLRPGVPAYDKRASWVEKAVNLMVPAAQAQTQQGGGMQNTGQGPSLSQLQSALQKAQAANDTNAVAKIQQALDSKVQQAYQRALDAGDTRAAEKIKGMMSQPVTAEAQPPQTTTEDPSFLQKAGQTADDLVRGIADAVTFGYADEIAAGAESLFGGGTYEEELAKQRQRDEQAGIARTIGQVGGALLPTVGVVRAVQGASRLGRAGAGAATGAIQGGLYGTGAAEGDIGDRVEGGLTGAAIGAPLGGLVSAAVPLTKAQQLTRFVQRSGGEDLARLDAEIVRRGQEILQDPLRKVGGKAKELTAADANQMIRDSFKREALDGLKQLPQSFPNRGALMEKVSQGKSLLPSEKELLAQDPVGRLLLPSIEAMQRVDVLTKPIKAAGGLRETARGVVGKFLPQWAADAVTAPLGRRATREDVIKKLVEGQGKVAGMVRQQLGSARPTASIQELTQLAAQASQREAAEKAAREAQNLAKKSEAATRKTAQEEAKRQAELRQGLADIQSKDPTYFLGMSNELGAPRNPEQMSEFSKLIRQQMEARVARQVAQREAQRAAQAGRTMQPREQILAASRTPLGGAFQELLRGGRSGLNLSTDEAIRALRLVSGQSRGTPIGEAANLIRRSAPEGIPDENAFYGLQNTIRRLQEQGILGTQPGALSNVSPVANPISYAAAVRTAEQARDIAVSNAPSNALKQFVTKVAGTKSPDEKAKLVMNKLATTTDPAEVEFLQTFVQPLTQFGRKAK